MSTETADRHPHGGEYGAGADSIKPVRLPAPDCGILIGLHQIAGWYGIGIGQARARIKDGSIVIFRLPRRTTIYALKAAQHAYWEEQSRKYQKVIKK